MLSNFIAFILLYVLLVLTVQDGALWFFGLHAHRERNGGVLDGSLQVTAGARGLEKVGEGAELQIRGAVK